jgi:ABC-type multidrug transport system fused ATPase/permease subunit
VLVIEHRLQLAAQADRVVRIEDGKAVEPAPQEALA